MRYLSKDDILKINYYQIQTFGGEYLGTNNLINPGSLDWVLEAIKYPIFGIYKYPTISEKSAITAWTINTKHVFHDGNKRTSMASLIVFLNINQLDLLATSTEIVDISIKAANSSINGFSFPEFNDWVKKRIIVPTNSSITFED